MNSLAKGKALVTVHNLDFVQIMQDFNSRIYNV